MITVLKGLKLNSFNTDNFEMDKLVNLNKIQNNWKGAQQCSQSWECRGARLCERGGW